MTKKTNLFLLLLLLGSCQTSKTTVRDLPAGLRPVSELLEGCQHATEADGGVAATCEGDVMFRVRTVEAEEGAPPRYFGDGVDLANNNAGRMTWAHVMLKTAYDQGQADRGEVHSVEDDKLVMLLLGAARKATEPGLQTEVSCQSPPDGEERCTQLVTSFLDLPPEGGHKKDSTSASSSGASQGHIAGRSISLSTSCKAIEQEQNRGHYACSDEAKLFWMITEDMDTAAQQAEAAMLSLEDVDERAPVKCALFDADTQCETTPSGIVALGYIDAKPLVVVCLTKDPWDHNLCKAAFRKR